MIFKSKNFLVFGLSKSGYSVTKELLKLKANCYIYEENDNLYQSGNLGELVELGARRVTTDTVFELLKNIDVLVVSPGVAINHRLCVKARELKIRIIGELELGYLLIKSPIIAVTGTNGKTTTVSIINKIFENANISHELVGNIGVPITSKVDKLQEHDAFAITEVSSFQLETIHNFTPHIACILNITPDHLERHYTMENYVYLKERILKNLRESEYAILNADDERIVSFAKNIKAKIIWVSLKNLNANARYEDGYLYYNNVKISQFNNGALKGEHNIYNALFAVAVAKIVGIEDSIISTALSEYKGEKHRIEFVGNFNGVDYYNDSKSTNTGATISALKTIKTPTILLLGGKEKGENYDLLFNEIKNSKVKAVIVCGESVKNMTASAINVGIVNLHIVNGLDQAVALADFLAFEGDTVLLSPSCSSFDRFSGYAERGEYFCELVKKLEEVEE